jgi:hypothetical protein
MSTLSQPESILLSDLIRDEVNHAGIPSAALAFGRLGMTPDEGREHVEGLEELALVRLRRVIGAPPYVEVTWRGREAAHQHGVEIPSPVADSHELIAFLRAPGDALPAGSQQFNDSLIMRRFDWPRSRALDAARVLADTGKVKLHTPSGTFFLFLTPLGRRGE